MSVCPRGLKSACGPFSAPSASDADPPRKPMRMLHICAGALERLRWRRPDHSWKGSAPMRTRSGLGGTVGGSGSLAALVRWITLSTAVGGVAGAAVLLPGASLAWQNVAREPRGDVRTCQRLTCFNLPPVFFSDLSRPSLLQKTHRSTWEERDENTHDKIQGYT